MIIYSRFIRTPYRYCTCQNNCYISPNWNRYINCPSAIPSLDWLFCESNNEKLKLESNWGYCQVMKTISSCSLRVRCALVYRQWSNRETIRDGSIRGWVMIILQSSHTQHCLVAWWYFLLFLLFIPTNSWAKMEFVWTPNWIVWNFPEGHMRMMMTTKPMNMHRISSFI